MKTDQNEIKHENPQNGSTTTAPDNIYQNLVETDHNEKYNLNQALSNIIKIDQIRPWMDHKYKNKLIKSDSKWEKKRTTMIKNDQIQLNLVYHYDADSTSEITIILTSI